MNNRWSLNVWPLETPDATGLKKFALFFLKLTEEEFLSFEIRGVKPARGALTTGQTSQELRLSLLGLEIVMLFDLTPLDSHLMADRRGSG